MGRIGLVVAALGLAGCVGPVDDYQLRIAPGADVQAALGAAGSWERQTGVRLRPLVTPEGCDVQDCIYLEETAPGHLGDGWLLGTCSSDPAHTLGCTVVAADGTNRAHVRVSDALDPARRAQAYRHELGHALGLGHDDGTPNPTVMRSDYGRAAQDVMPEDAWRYIEARQGLHL